jgi:hypothetical protein
MQVFDDALLAEVTSRGRPKSPLPEAMEQLLRGERSRLIVDASASTDTLIARARARAKDAHKILQVQSGRLVGGQKVRILTIAPETPATPAAPAAAPTDPSAPAAPAAAPTDPSAPAAPAAAPTAPQG